MHISLKPSIVRTKTVDDFINRQLVDTSNTSIIHGSNVNFFRKGNIIFSTYYVKNNVNGQDVICEIQYGTSIYYLKMNDYSILDHRITSYLPEMLFVKNSKDDLLFVVLPEGDKGRKTLVVKVYKINYEPSLSLSQLYKMQLISCNNYAREEVKYPVILHQDIVGRVLIVARVDNDYRSDTTDRLYVMWKLEYKNDKFEIVNLNNGYMQFNAAYLFKHSGYINYGKCRDRLIMKLGLGNFIDFLYVVKHISKDYNFFSNIYDISVNYNINLDPEECLIGSSYRCNASGNRKYNIPNSCIHVIDVLRDEKDVYIAYIGTVFDSKFGNKKQLVIVYTVLDKQLSMYDFMHIEENVSAIYINSIGDILAMITMGPDNLIRYEVSKLQLKLGIVDHINVVKIPRKVVKNIANFAYIVDGVLGLNNIEHVNISNVSTTKSTVSYKVSQFFLSIREIEFHDLFKNLNGIYSNVSTGIHAVPTSDSVNYTTIMFDEELPSVTTRYLSSFIECFRLSKFYSTVNIN